MKIHCSIFIFFLIFNNTHCSNTDNQTQLCNTPIHTINLESFDLYFFSANFLQQIQQCFNNFNNLYSKEYFPRGVQLRVNLLNNTILFLKTFTIQKGNLVLHILINSQADTTEAKKQALKQLNEIKKKNPYLNNFNCNNAELVKAFQEFSNNKIQ